MVCLRLALAATIAALALVPGALASEPAYTTVSTSGAHVRAPQIAGDGAGRAVVVWRALVGDAWVVQAAVRPPGGAFAEPETISGTGADVDQARVAMDGAGTATAVWQRADATGVAIQASTRPADGAWSAPATISPAGARALDPIVVANAAGDVAVLWTRLEAGGTTLQVARRPAGGDWRPAQTVSAAGPLEPALAIGAGGDLAAIWRQPDGPFTLAVAAVRPKAGPWGAPTALSAPGRTAGGPDVAVDGQGGVVAVWTRSEGGLPVVQWSEQTPGGAWSAPRDLSQPGRKATEPTIVVLPSGDATAAWIRGDDLEVATRQAGATTWSGTTAPAFSWYGKPAALQLAVDADGSTTVVGARERDLIGAYREAGKDWGRTFTLVARYDAEAYGPRVIVDGNSRATAVYALNTERDEMAVAASYDAQAGVYDEPDCDPAIEDCADDECDPEFEDCTEERRVAGPGPIVRLRADGRLDVIVVCPVAAGCRGSVALRALPPGRAVASDGPSVLLGSARYVARGPVTYVHLRVSPWQQRLLRGEEPVALVAVARIQRWTGRSTTIVRSVVLVEQRVREPHVPPPPR